MNRHLVVIRPEPGNASTVSTAKKMGFDPVSMPLQTFTQLDWQIPAGAFDALLVGSANVFRLGGSELQKLRDIPVLAVGETTAENARESGFTVKAVGKGGLQQLIDELPQDRSFHLLRLGGQAKIPVNLPPTVKVEANSLFRLEDLRISSDQIHIFADPTCVLVHSALAGRNFLKNCEELSLDRSKIQLLTLGSRIAKGLGKGWGAVHCASTPNDAALLALAKQVCL